MPFQQGQHPVHHIRSLTLQGTILKIIINLHRILLNILNLHNLHMIRPNLEPMIITHKGHMIIKEEVMTKEVDMIKGDTILSNMRLNLNKTTILWPSHSHSQGMEIRSLDIPLATQTPMEEIWGTEQNRKCQIKP